MTVLSELEATINDRPLTYTSGDLEDLIPITPSQLVRGRRLKSFPMKSNLEELMDPSYASSQVLQRRLDYITKVSEDMWKRWVNEYLLSLRISHNCIAKNKVHVWPKLGDIVLIHDEGPRLMWKLGRITGLYTGRDGLVRVAQLKTNTGTTTRPAVKLFPLEQDLDYDPVDPPPEEPDDGEAVCYQRPPRQAALGSAALWKSRLATGQL